MAHYLNDYFKLRGHVVALEKKLMEMQEQLKKAKSSTESMRSFIEVEIGHLKQVVEKLEEKLSSKNKKRKQLDNALIKVHHKLANSEAHIDVVV